jgi:hypothetical protein
MMYVTLELAKNHLNMDHDEDDFLIGAYARAASAAVKNYLKSASPYQYELDADDSPVYDTNGDLVYVIDTSGDRVVRDEVQSAVLILIGHLYRDRDGNEGSAYEQGYLPKPVTALLYPLRTPALA